MAKCDDPIECGHQAALGQWEARWQMLRDQYEPSVREHAELHVTMDRIEKLLPTGLPVVGMLLVKFPDKGRWINPKTAEEWSDTWGNISAEEAIAQAQSLIAQQGDVGDAYEILEVTVKKHAVVKAQRVGVVQ